MKFIYKIKSILNFIFFGSHDFKQNLKINKYEVNLKQYKNFIYYITIDDWESITSRKMPTHNRIERSGSFDSDNGIFLSFINSTGINKLYLTIKVDEDENVKLIETKIEVFDFIIFCVSIAGIMLLHDSWGLYGFLLGLWLLSLYRLYIFLTIKYQLKKIHIELHYLFQLYLEKTNNKSS